MKRVAITGPEGSGKSILAAGLSDVFSTSYASEYAREYLAMLNKPYSSSDLDIICAGQLRLEVSAISRATELCFFDTDMLVMDVWSKFRFGNSSSYISRAYNDISYDAYLLCYPDLIWEADGMRESPDLKERLELFEMYNCAILDRSNRITF